MERAIVVRGTLSDPTHIELDEPVTEIQGGAVEIVVRCFVETPTAVISQQTNYHAWAAAFDAWVEDHNRTVSLPSPESLRRENIYEDRT